MLPSISSPVRAKAGFSLVEVLLALGLVTFAFLVIFSLMPMGLISLQESGRQIVETEIFNNFDAELSSTPFANLDTYVNERFPAYFDHEGNEVPAAKAVFTVRCNLLAPSLGAGELRRASVLIGFNSDPSGAVKQMVNKRTFLLANRGT